MHSCLHVTHHHILLKSAYMGNTDKGTRVGCGSSFPITRFCSFFVQRGGVLFILSCLIIFFHLCMFYFILLDMSVSSLFYPVLPVPWPGHGFSSWMDSFLSFHFSLSPSSNIVSV